MHTELSVTVSNLGRFFDECLDGRCREASPGSDERFEQLALRLFTLQHALNEPYRRLCDARGIDPVQVRNWRAIPPVSTAAFKEATFSCLDPSDRTAYFESSGTTHTSRSRTHHSEASLRLYHASLLPWFQQHLLPATSSSGPITATRDFISLTPTSTQAPHSSLVHMLDVVSKQPGWCRTTFAGTSDATTGWTTDAAVFIEVVDRAAAEARPVVVTGTAFNFVHLMDAMDGRSLRLPPGSRLMETGGYKGRSREMPKAKLHAALATTFRVRTGDIVTEYGMTELGSQAYDHVAGDGTMKRVLQFPPWARTTVISLETGREVAVGEVGVVRIVDLANACSVIAIETEDLAIRHPHGIELLDRRTDAEPRGCSLMVV